MRISTAYFAGVGTVIVAVGAGLGGGYLARTLPTADAGGLQAGTQDVGGTDTVATAPAEPVPHVAARTNPLPRRAGAAATQPQPQTQQQPHAQMRPSTKCGAASQSCAAPKRRPPTT
jgi:hypothetical protein